MANPSTPWITFKLDFVGATRLQNQGFKLDFVGVMRVQNQGLEKHGEDIDKYRPERVAQNPVHPYHH